MEGKFDRKLGNRLKEWTLGALVEAGEDVERMMETPGWGVIDRLLAEHRAEALENFVSGQTVGDLQSARSQGFIEGLSLAADAAATVLERARRARDELTRAAAEQEAAERG